MLDEFLWCPTFIALVAIKAGFHNTQLHLLSIEPPWR